MLNGKLEKNLHDLKYIQKNLALKIKEKLQRYFVTNIVRKQTLIRYVFSNVCCILYVYCIISFFLMCVVYHPLYTAEYEIMITSYIVRILWPIGPLDVGSLISYALRYTTFPYLCQIWIRFDNHAQSPICMNLETICGFPIPLDPILKDEEVKRNSNFYNLSLKARVSNIFKHFESMRHHHRLLAVGAFNWTHWHRSQQQHVVRYIWYISPQCGKEIARSAHFINNCKSQKNRIHQQFLMACPLQAK